MASAASGCLEWDYEELSMSIDRAKLGLALLGSIVLFSLVSAEQADKGDPASEDKQVVGTKATPQPAASSINFRKELKLPFPSLSTLGARIEAARRAPDPVALAHAANELSTAEKVSGKTASLTSAMLIKESAELAALRKQEAELNAIYNVSSQMAVAEDNLALTRAQIASAKAQAQADIQAQQRNEEPTSAPRQVVVNNYTTQYVDVYINGFLKSQIVPGASQVYTIEHRWNPTVLKAYGNEDSSVWGPRYIWGRFTKYTWNIN
jgi:hypothetical protein